MPDDNSPATERISIFSSRICTFLSKNCTRLKQELHQDLIAIENRLVEKMRDMQTELLRGFAAFSEAQTIRLRKVEADQSNLDAALSGRVAVLEKRLSKSSSGSAEPDLSRLASAVQCVGTLPPAPRGSVRIEIPPTMNHLKRLIREVPDFPKPGINFYDITTLLKDAGGLKAVIDGLGGALRGQTAFRRWSGSRRAGSSSLRRSLRV